MDENSQNAPSLPSARGRKKKKRERSAEASQPKPKQPWRQVQGDRAGRKHVQGNVGKASLPKRHENSSGEPSQGRPSHNAVKPEARVERLGFRRLESLAKEDGLTIMQVLSKEDLTALFADLIPKCMKKIDWAILIVTILAKLCTVAYDAIVIKLMARVCNNEFLNHLMLHIVCIEEIEKRTEIATFLHSLCDLYLGLVRRLPSLACERLGKFIQRTKGAMKDDIPSFSGMEVVSEKLDQIEAMLEQLQVQRSQAPVKVTSDEEALQFVDPPNNFREMSVIPTPEDLMSETRPFLRPNIPKGPFQNVEHYLDVHFRLMREDFMRPLRLGVQELKGKLRGDVVGRKGNIRVDNVRYYENVHFAQVETENKVIGISLCFDPGQKWCTRVNWEYSKRFMFGSLVVLTQNNFADIILATVSSKKDVEKGYVLVELSESSLVDIKFNSKYTMIESQVFYEPYRHVMRALQMFDENSFPLVAYIVQGVSDHQPPGYLADTPMAEYEIRTEDHKGGETEHLHIEDLVPLLNNDGEGSNLHKFHVLNEALWPTAEELKLDESQHKALIGALTRKVTLIQGPPGTGKTFLALKVAETLLRNQNYWTAPEKPHPILVVCYTNHALDQFLTGISKFTHKIVRVGGGCRDEDLQKKTLKNLQFHGLGGYAHRQLMYQLRNAFLEKKESLQETHYALKQLKSCSGIVSLHTLCSSGVLTAEQCPFKWDEDFLLWLLGGIPGFQRRDSHLIKFHYDIFEMHADDLAKVFYSQGFYFAISFAHVEDYATKYRVIDYYDSLYILQQQLVSEKSDPKHLDVNGVQDLSQLWTLPFDKRLQLYRFWVENLSKALMEEARLREVEYQEARLRHEEGQMIEDQYVMQDNLVIGMTTTYASKHQRILKQLKPRIVIIEEAAEVMESHVIVSLAGDCQHLVLIGDHQQLRPNPAVFELAKKYHMDISLFERLLNNGVDCVTLTTQHRMRPEIARLISPAIYPVLINHESVMRYEPMKGILKSVFFIDHTCHEEEVVEAKSFKNTHEGDFIVSLVRYLLQQGYNASQITILSTYKGQQHLFSTLRKSHSCLEKVRVTVVDNYQGEENDIILLSLVRSNKEQKVGFLATENRVCVALSRAKKGLYIIGNMNNLTVKGELWPKVKDELIKTNSFGEELTLYCSIHQTQNQVKCSKDFSMKCPEGGCLEPCKVLLSCGHTCERVCHVKNREHVGEKCLQECIRMCPQGHVCPLRCYQECLPCKVPKMEVLSCKHTAEMPCHYNPTKWRCKTLIIQRLVPCGHEMEMECFLDPGKEQCYVPCQDRLDCGHTCTLFCHLMDDPEHKTYQCVKPCTRTNLECKEAHQCTKRCHEDCDLCVVLLMKTLPCGHQLQMPCHSKPSKDDCTFKCSLTRKCGHKCNKYCRENCYPCFYKVTKMIPKCKHVQKMACSEDENDVVCESKCERLLPCGHACTLTCGVPCNTDCKKLVDCESPSPCGHKVLVHCSKRNSYSSTSAELLALCKHPCGQTLACSHVCKGTCSGCLQGQFHEACKEECGRVLICGHTCKSPCSVNCPPCTKPCEMLCAHSKCPRKCGQPCTPCMEPCSRKCPHKRCLRQCSEVCAQQPCYEPCQKKLRCKHNCVGYCGDPCPPKCRICDKEELETVFFGHEDEKNARFVLLPDCNHVVESQGLETWLQEGDEIKPKVCPLCVKPIMTCMRYDGYVKKHAADVSKVKVKIYGSLREIKSITDDALNEINNIGTIELNEVPLGMTQTFLIDLRMKLKRIKDSLPKKRGRTWNAPFSLTEVKNLLTCCQFLKTVKKALEPLKLAGKPRIEEVASFVEKLSRNVQKRTFTRLSEQEAKDINWQLMKLNHLSLVVQIESSPNIRLLSQSLLNSLKEIASTVRGWHKYPMDVQFTKQLQAIAKEVDVKVTREEIKYVVAAMGERQGHWFNCPNGHPYFIGECGGAMEVGKCNDCGAPIGGSAHRLLPTNTLATNIDGATRGAWPGALH